ncbi:hypothetical protein PybrP1_008997 [[Pythium] brassicae (nom. inval.)]|nr:hypothetical protein PybrP1_008997 [[Pythium] brassicae (nom. inval.)]
MLVLAVVVRRHRRTTWRRRVARTATAVVARIRAADHECVHDAHHVLVELLHLVLEPEQLGAQLVHLGALDRGAAVGDRAALDLAQEVAAAAHKLVVAELPPLFRVHARRGLGVHAHLAEAVEVELPHERTKVLVLEVDRDDVLGELDRLLHDEALARGRRPARDLGRALLQHLVRLLEEHGRVLEPPPLVRAAQRLAAVWRVRRVQPAVVRGRRRRRRHRRGRAVGVRVDAQRRRHVVVLKLIRLVARGHWRRRDADADGRRDAGRAPGRLEFDVLHCGVVVHLDVVVVVVVIVFLRIPQSPPLAAAVAVAVAAARVVLAGARRRRRLLLGLLLHSDRAAGRRAAKCALGARGGGGGCGGVCRCRASCHGCRKVRRRRAAGPRREGKCSCPPRGACLACLGRGRSPAPPLLACLAWAKLREELWPEKTEERSLRTSRLRHHKHTISEATITHLYARGSVAVLKVQETGTENKKKSALGLAVSGFRHYCLASVLR